MSNEEQEEELCALESIYGSEVVHVSREESLVEVGPRGNGTATHAPLSFTSPSWSLLGCPCAGPGLRRPSPRGDTRSGAACIPTLRLPGTRQCRAGHSTLTRMVGDQNPGPHHTVMQAPNDSEELP